jgi:hypothetical protein
VRTTTFCALAAACALVAVGVALGGAADARGHAEVVPNDQIETIRKLRRETWRWQKLMAVPRTRAEGRALAAVDAEYRAWVLELWRTRAAKARRKAQNPPREAAWRCIHRHERHPRQGWRTNTGNGYYGGLQMDLSFQRTYGGWLLRRKGTADRWKPIEQIWVAERAYRSGRGFHPWPNTARACGLLKRGNHGTPVRPHHYGVGVCPVSCGRAEVVSMWRLPGGRCASSGRSPAPAAASGGFRERGSVHIRRVRGSAGVSCSEQLTPAPSGATRSEQPRRAVAPAPGGRGAAGLAAPGSSLL